MYCINDEYSHSAGLRSILGAGCAHLNLLRSGGLIHSLRHDLSLDDVKERKHTLGFLPGDPLCIKTGKIASIGA